jgi:uncharacterized cupredoxin-like copper-binding protein
MAGRLVVLAGGPALVVAGLFAASGALGSVDEPPIATTVEITMRYSRFTPAAITVPAGVPVTFILRNDDPIDHEWIVATESVHDRHRTSTELVHGDLPSEIPVDAGTVRTTTITFDRPGRLAFICHLPGHEAYGMTGSVTIVGGS